MLPQQSPTPVVQQTAVQMEQTTTEETAASVGISSSVAVFILVTSVCCILSLAATDSIQENRGTQMNRIRVPHYTPGIAMLCVMSIGIVAMVVFILKRRDLTTGQHESTSRHKLHTKYSLSSILAFFIGVCVLCTAYLIVEFSCLDKWTNCDNNRVEVYLANLMELIFRIVLVVFASCETIICWLMKHLKFKPSQWVWHGLAIVQAANIAFWFDALLEESYHRIEEDYSFHAYFSFCNTTLGMRNTSCSSSSTAGQLFIYSSTIFHPMSIEFSLLVGETLLQKVMGATSHENAEHDSPSIAQGNYASSVAMIGVSTSRVPSRDGNSRTESRLQSTSTERTTASREQNLMSSMSRRSVRLSADSNSSFYSADDSVIENDLTDNNAMIDFLDERRPLLMSTQSVRSNPESMRHPVYSGRSKIFILISVIVNIIYLMLGLLVFIGTIKSNKSPKTRMASNYSFVVYSVVHCILLIICCAVGMLSCRKFKRRPSNTSYLEYLLLFATCGVLFQEIKRMVALSVNSATLGWTLAYFMFGFSDVIQVMIQSVFYYYSKDMKPLSSDDGRHAENTARVVVFKNIARVISISNVALWLSDSFFFSAMNTYLMPTGGSMEQWPVFDNVAIPITIFYRFNSALLFWCIATDPFPRIEHQD